MFNDLEQFSPKNIKTDETLRVMMESFRSELKQKMTRSEVLSLVNNLVQGAKEDMKENTGDLMIGRKKYRCIV